MQSSWHIVDLNCLDHGPWTILGPYKGLGVGLSKHVNVYMNSYFRFSWEFQYVIWLKLSFYKSSSMLNNKNIWIKIFLYRIYYTTLCRYFVVVLYVSITLILLWPLHRWAMWPMGLYFSIGKIGKYLYEH